MAKKAYQSDTTTWRREKENSDKLCIKEAVEELNGVLGAKPAVEFLTLLEQHAGQSWLELKKVQYAYADEIYSNRHWLTENQKALPPGTTFLGIVLDKTLEVSVVETFKSNPKRKYHRPMSILPKGAIFGTFETADLMCQTELLQEYTVFSGLRTFFFSDPIFEPNAVGRAEFMKAMKSIAQEEQPLTDWFNSDNGFSPTQTPLFFLRAFLGAELKAWRSKILLIAIGSEFLANVSNEVKQIVWRGAWRQSAHLRQQTISAYSTDEIMEILGGNRRKPSEKHKKVSEKFRSAIARELRTLPMLLTEGRPGFREILVKRKKESSGQSEASTVALSETEAFGPFVTFFETIEKKRSEAAKCKSPQHKEFTKAIESAVYVPRFLFDDNTELTFPLWPNFDPNEIGGQKSNSNDVFKSVLKTIEPYWAGIRDELLAGDLGYSKNAALLKVWDQAESLDSIKQTVPSLLRGPVRIQDTCPRLPLFAAVGKLEDGKSAAALIGVQHLMEETICLIREVIERKLVEASKIWLLGKPYSSNHRVAHRLAYDSVNARAPRVAPSLAALGRWYAGLESQPAPAGLKDSSAIKVPEALASVTARPATCQRRERQSPRHRRVCREPGRRGRRHAHGGAAGSPGENASSPHAAPTNTAAHGSARATGGTAGGYRDAAARTAGVASTSARA